MNSQACLHEFKLKVLGGPDKSRRNIGHTGTLDPFAEGILLCGWGEGTKLLAPLTGLDKSYEATFAFGATTDTLDDTSPLKASAGWKAQEALLRIADPKAAAEFLQSQLGDFEQVPPLVSAVHIDGKRGYEWARQGIEKELKPRRVSLREATALAPPAMTAAGLIEWKLRVRVSSGTYIRALARDWGLKLFGSAGHLRRLVRTAVGPFSMPHASDGEMGHKKLNLSDLTCYFEVLKMGPEGINEIRRFGRYEPQARSSAALVVGPHDDLVAWIEAGSGRLGRVFRTNGLSD